MTVAPSRLCKISEDLDPSKLSHHVKFYSVNYLSVSEPPSFPLSTMVDSESQPLLGRGKGTTTGTETFVQYGTEDQVKCEVYSVQRDV